MVLTGRVDRGTRPAIWIYKHAESRGELYLDATGQAYKFTKTPNARSFGRFTPCSLDAAMWRAGLPSFVEPVFYDEPPRGTTDLWDDDGWRDDEPLDDAPPAAEPRRRGHLTVIDGGRGRPLAG
jgi:hypothetical protein